MKKNQKIRNNFKTIVTEVLKNDNYKEEIEKLKNHKKVINTLFKFFYDDTSILKERAIEVMGILVNEVAKKEIEYARVIMRRLMWSLNDESGGIGWGAPLAMAEIMINNKKLFDEYHKILFSYGTKGANFIDFEGLRKEVLIATEKLKQKYGAK